ncbi:MAG: UDP-glucose/GDP-mannose dehydrogenase family protein [Actinomycetota bacterium]|nr:UDP-glucose/GDP-mannose dehydrogenase family protein [Actinomycetota bacterium]
MQITVIGAGHVGTVCAACLTAIGHRVSVLDVDEQRIGLLRAGRMPFVEPGLDELMSRGREGGLLSFHTDPAEALPEAELMFLCVNTDSGPDGSADISAIESAVRVVSRFAGPESVLVNRSTAPVGTADYIRSLSEEFRGSPLRVAVNPEFLAEGTAVADFLSPDRILVGAWEEGSIALLTEAYEPILKRRLPSDVRSLATGNGQRPEEVPLVVTTPASAELAKYAANSFLAVKISFINEIAGIAEEVGADITKISEALGLDRRIGHHFLRAGIGWGGSCFPKDILALQGIAETRGLSARILRAANEVNTEQSLWTIRKLQRHLKTVFGRRVALLGLSFKPNTDDVRKAPALEIAAQLARANVDVRAYDPVVKSLPGDLGDKITLSPDPVSAVRGADALVIVTEWPEFARLDLLRLKDAMRTPLFLDGRNLFDPEEVRAAGFIYVGVGREDQAAELTSVGTAHAVSAFVTTPS